MTNETFVSLLLDKSENLWVGGSRGVEKFSLKDFYKTGKVKITHFGPSEGFLATECNQNACLQDSKGNLWFGTINGAFLYNPLEDRKNLIPSRTYITGIRLFFEEISWDNYSDSVDSKTGLPVNLRLSHHDNHLTFH